MSRDRGFDRFLCSAMIHEVEVKTQNNSNVHQSTPEYTIRVLTMNTPSLTLHAELLPNIRQTTLYISLPTDPQLQPLEMTISLSESRRAVSVSLPAPFDHVSETIKLPARVHEASRRVLMSGRQRDAGTQEGSQGDNGNREMSFRMQIDPADAACLVPGEEITGDYVPWMAGDMGPLARLRCRGCENVVLDSKCSGFSAASADSDVNGTASTGRVWKDLPSGNWAEMMDFWHCHKPDSHDHDHGDNTVSIEERNSQVKGYGAANQVVAARGTVLVDVPTFLVAESDCRGLKKVRYGNCPAFVSLCEFLRIISGTAWAKRRRPLRSHGLAFDTIALN